jgi:5-methylcytosine-specific restriction endonuclease McrA
MFGGRCAYCGCVLKDESGKYMQIDHIKPIRRNYLKNNSLFPENDNEENLFPACPKCNNYKYSMNIEEFRNEIRRSNEKLKVYASFNNAVRFGMIEIKQWDGLFWFEKFGNPE